MTGRAARFASAGLLASLLPLTANATSEVSVVHVAAALETAGSTGSLINPIVDARCFNARLISRRDGDVAADTNTLNVRTGGSFVGAAGAVVPAQIKT
jgi:hypothetical protein